MITCPADMTPEIATGVATIVVLWDPPSPTDNDGVPSLQSSPPLGTAFPEGDNIVTYTATDRSGNVKQCMFTISVIGMLIRKKVIWR